MPDEGNGKKRASGSALFDLEADIGEKTNVLKDHPAVAERLREYVRAFQKDLDQNSRPAAFVKKPRPLAKSTK